MLYEVITVANAINDYLNLWSNNENKHIESAKKEYKKYVITSYSIHYTKLYDLGL